LIIESGKEVSIKCGTTYSYRPSDISYKYYYITIILVPVKYVVDKVALEWDFHWALSSSRVSIILPVRHIYLYRNTAFISTTIGLSLNTFRQSKLCLTLENIGQQSIFIVYAF